MTTELLVIVPTRGRRLNVSQLAEAFFRTSGGSARLFFSQDVDDPEKTEVLTWVADFGFAPNKTMNEALNAHLESLLPDATAVGFMGDDHRPRTPMWDVRVMEALDAMGTGIVYGNDLFQGPNLPTAVFMTADIVRELGYIAPPCLAHLELDTYWLALGRGAECIEYLPDVIIEHMHPEAGKAPNDEGYDRMNALRARDHVAYEEYKSSGAFDADVAKIKALQVIR